MPALQLSGAEDRKRGRLNERPLALRSLEDLQKDTAKTGLQVPGDLPERFPIGPWLVNLDSHSDDKDGWRAVEERVAADLKNWASDPNKVVGDESK